MDCSLEMFGGNVSEKVIIELVLRNSVISSPLVVASADAGGLEQTFRAPRRSLTDTHFIGWAAEKVVAQGTARATFHRSHEGQSSLQAPEPYAVLGIGVEVAIPVLVQYRQYRMRIFSRPIAKSTMHMQRDLA